MVFKIFFSQSVNCLFIFIDCFYFCAEMFHLTSYLLILAFVAWAFGVISKKNHCQNLSGSFSPRCSPMNFLWIMQDRGPISFLCICISNHLLKKLSLQHRVFLDAFSSISWLYMPGYISGFSILFHWFMCQFLCHYHTVLITIALYYTFKSSSVMSDFTFVLFQDFIVYSGSFVVPYKF